MSQQSLTGDISSTSVPVPGVPKKPSRFRVQCYLTDKGLLCRC